MIACLDMYNWPESRDAFDRLWYDCRNGLRESGFDAPQDLSHNGEDLAAAARDGSLILGQVCGITFARANHIQPTYKPLAALIGADGNGPRGYYTSVVIARDAAASIQDLLSKRFAVNGWTSYSGWYGLRHHLITSGLSIDLPLTVVSGAHRRSVEMVASGDAEWAVIDSISWGMLKRIAPALTASVHVIDQTMAVPGLPLVTSCHTPPDIVTVLQQRLTHYFDTPQGRSDFTALGITGMEIIDAATYAPLRHNAGDC